MSWMRKPFPFTAVLFDLDGVLIDATDLHYRVWDEFARARGFVPSREQILATNGRRADETIRLWLRSSLTDHQVAAIAAERETYFNRLLEKESVPVVPGAVELVDEVRTAGLPYALVTSSEPEVVDAVLAGLDVEFPVIVCAADVAHTKPDPEGYLLAAAKLGAEPGQCIALEDSVNGVTAAEAAGFRTVAVPSVVPVPERPGRVVVESLAGMTLAELAARAGFAI